MCGSFGNEQDALEGHLSLGCKVNMGQWFITVLTETLVKCNIVGIIDLLGASEPDGLVIVHYLPVVHSLVYHLDLGKGQRLGGSQKSWGKIKGQKDGEGDKER